ncbi:hypothetical protein REPUB_Repub11eG0067500 [Reevesia pubescens]
MVDDDRYEKWVLGFHMGDEQCHVWVMKEYGLEESWTKLLSIEKLEGVPEVVGESLVLLENVNVINHGSNVGDSIDEMDDANETSDSSDESADDARTNDLSDISDNPTDEGTDDSSDGESYFSYELSE